MKNFCFIIFLTCIFNALRSENTSDILKTRLDNQLYEFPQEKIHLTTDRDNYMGGDTIWFRAFVVDAISHQQVATSKYIYVELRNPFNQVETRVKIMEHDGIYKGYVPLSLNIAEGPYMLTSYTMFMQNRGETYFFKKMIPVKSPFSTQVRINTQFTIDKEENTIEAILSYTNLQSGAPQNYDTACFSFYNGDQKQDNYSQDKNIKLKISSEQQELGYFLAEYDKYAKYIKLPDTSGQFDVSFHPEGGYLIPGEVCKIAFKGINSSGNGIDVTGRIFDSNNNEIAYFNSIHAGMGITSFIPKYGETYYAECNADSLGSNIFMLPAVEPAAAIISATNVNDSIITLQAKGNLPDSAFIFMQERGLYVYSQSIQESAQLSVDCSDIPSGVMQILLLDKNMNTLSERLLFFKQDDICNNIGIRSSKPIYENRDKVKLQLDIDKSNFSGGGSIAISVTDNFFHHDISRENIATNLLLQSELTGHIEDPEYYFHHVDSTKRVALDALMMTQGWRRYDIPSALRGEFTYPTFPIEKGQVISGSVKSLWKKKPLDGANVKILSKNASFARVAKTDSLGNFMISGFNHVDGTRYDLEAVNKKGKTEFNLAIDSDSFPKISLIPFYKIHRTNDNNVELTAELSRLKASGNAFNIILDELVVAKVVNDFENKDISEILARKSFDSREMESKGYTSIEEVLLRIAGIRITPDGNVTYRNAPVIFIADGLSLITPTDDDALIGIQGPVSATKWRGLTGLARASAMALERVKSYPVPNSGILNEVEALYPFDMIERIDFLSQSEALIYGVSSSIGGAVVITAKDESQIKERPYGLKTYRPLGYQEPAEFYSPKYPKEFDNTSDGSDFRNTVYWNPVVDFDSEGKAFVEFFANDIEKTSYTIKIEGVADNGRLIQATGSIRKH